MCGNVARSAIVQMVNRETDAWNRRDAQALIQLFHVDMVWPWPPTARSHDPETWVMPLGRFDADRWRLAWQELFDTHDLVRNDRTIIRVEVAPEGDAGFAVVDINTVWVRYGDRLEDQWTGRVCKVYSLCADGWKMTMHTGALDYGGIAYAAERTPRQV